uniref:Uncharacterized protein n=1 Tax=Romanomermis culicivorax TaxID=13658 RepID=A0A915HGS7_ROMCU
MVSKQRRSKKQACNWCGQNLNRNIKSESKSDKSNATIESSSKKSSEKESKHGFQKKKASSVARNPVTSSQELMPPPATPACEINSMDANIYIMSEPVENLFLAIVEEPEAEPIVVDITPREEPVTTDPVDKSKINSTITHGPKITTGTKVGKSFYKCQKKHLGKFCGSCQVGHTIEYFDSGEFKHKCMHCQAKMLRSEFFGRASRCCHKGQDHGKTSSCMADGKCNKYFPKKFLPLTILSESDFPLYKRGTPSGLNETKTDLHRNTSLKMYPKTGKSILLDKRFVVPYNAIELLKYTTHSNLEHIAAQKSMEYMFKYIMKGHNMAYVHVQNDPVINYDKMDNIIRYMTGIEGYFNISGFPIVHRVTDSDLSDEV